MSLLDMSEDSAHPDQRTGQTRCDLIEKYPYARQIQEAAQVWAALTPLLAGRPQVWVCKDSNPTRRGQFLRRNMRKLTPTLPKHPAAVPLYSNTGTTKTLVIDLDTSKTSPTGVDRDLANLTKLIASSGGALITDHSPAGGRHAYLPLQQEVTFHDALQVAKALAARYPSIDLSPNYNLRTGLIRPPGAAHRGGGHQTLDGTVSAAHKLAVQRNPPSVWNALKAALNTELNALHTSEATADPQIDTAPTTAGSGRIRTDLASIARTGDITGTPYKTPSDARQAVLVSAAAAGMTLPQVRLRMHNGIWPGLAAFYHRYKPTQQPRSLQYDWERAQQFIRKQPSEKPSPNYGDNSHTSRHPHTGGTPAPPVDRITLSSAPHRIHRGTPAEFQFIREWWTALQTMELQRYPGRSGPNLRMILRALGQAAMSTGSRYTAWGTRSLAVATGLDHSTVAAHLRALRSEPDPFIDLIENDRGLDGDLYQLTIPAHGAVHASRRPWRPGKIRSLRPAFRELGIHAAFVYEALENAATSARLTAVDLSRQLGMDRKVTTAALETLAAYDLAERTKTGWKIIATTSLSLLAELLDVSDTITVQLNTYKAERQAYRTIYNAYLRVTGETTPAGGWDQWSAPADEHQTLVELLQRRLGGTVLMNQG